MMNSNSESIDDGSVSMDDDDKQRSRSHITRSSAGSTSSNGTTSNNGTKRSKDISPCYVCGAKAHGYNFDQSN